MQGRDRGSVGGRGSRCTCCQYNYATILTNNILLPPATAPPAPAEHRHLSPRLLQADISHSYGLHDIGVTCPPAGRFRQSLASMIPTRSGTCWSAFESCLARPSPEVAEKASETERVERERQTERQRDRETERQMITEPTPKPHQQEREQTYALSPTTSHNAQEKRKTAQKKKKTTTATNLVCIAPSSRLRAPDLGVSARGREAGAGSNGTGRAKRSEVGGRRGAGAVASVKAPVERGRSLVGGGRRRTRQR
eukprot:1339058-Rhodomonas_salina.2